MEKSKNQNLKIPKERRIKENDTKGEIDEDGFFRTPNGSFWDCDGEYFNRYGYDIHGGSYSNILDYVPGPSWIDELGCYPEEKEKYMKDDFDNDFEEGDADLDLKEGEEDICVEDYKKLGISKEDLANILDKYNLGDKKEKKKKKGIKEKKKKKKDEDDEWEEIDDDE